MKFYGEQFLEDLLGITGGGGEGTHQAARRVPGAAPLLAAPGTLLGAWWPPSVPPFSYISPLGWKPLKKSRFHVSSPPRGGNLQRRKAIFGGQIPPGRSPPGREIVAIIIIVVTGIIEIIINIIPNISTISISIPSHLSIATCVVIRTIYPLYSVGVDYYFVVNAIEFCWRNIIVSRLFATHLSPLIMISFMSCE